MHGEAKEAVNEILNHANGLTVQSGFEATMAVHTVRFTENHWAKVTLTAGNGRITCEIEGLGADYGPPTIKLDASNRDDFAYLLKVAVVGYWYASEDQIESMVDIVQEELDRNCTTLQFVTSVYLDGQSISIGSTEDFIRVTYRDRVTNGIVSADIAQLTHNAFNILHGMRLFMRNPTRTPECDYGPPRPKVIMSVNDMPQEYGVW
ncbi:hypothetical protein [Xanthomonas phage JGB6]|nr:hypothetical protein [Xanthomonas phage JGB6]